MSKLLTYNEFPLHTRIGNKLFNYGFLQGCVVKYDRELIMPDYFLWDFLKEKPEIDNNAKGEVIFHHLTDRFDPGYYDKFFEENRDKSVNINLNPFSQMERTWEHCKDYFLEMLKFKDEKIEEVREQYKGFFDKPTIGMSIRLGTDYTHSKDFIQIPAQWYIYCLDKYFPNWREQYTVVCFSDNIELAKAIFKNYPFKYASANKTYIMKFDEKHFHDGKAAMNHLILGYLMDNFVIGCSTFSWWMAYLSQNRVGNFEGKVICSNRNFDGVYAKTMQNIDYYPQSFVKQEFYEENEQIITLNGKQASI